jgi:hypothetical protein
MPRFRPVSRSCRAAFVAAVLGVLVLGAHPAGAADLCPAPPFVKVENGQLKAGAQRFRVKGANFIPFRYISRTGNGHFSQWLQAGDSRCSIDPGQTIPGECDQPIILEMWGPKYNLAEIEAEMGFLKRELGINTLRLLTPSEPRLGQDVPSRRIPLIQFWSWQAWFNPDGTLATHYVTKMQEVLAAAARQGLRVHVTLAMDMAIDATASGWLDKIAPSSLLLHQPLTLRQFYRNYMASPRRSCCGATSTTTR